jgi:GDSL-like Lipase/Acylhydrolase family
MQKLRAAAVVAILVLLGCAASAAQAADRYVALGDSYAAGPLIPVQLPPFGCLKSSNNYAHLAQLDLNLPEFQDPTCSGAKTDHMTATQGVTPGPNPPQFDSLSPDTKLVTLGISGNDIGFSSIAQDCFSSRPSSGSPCKDRYTEGGTDEVSQRIADTAPKVASVLQGIHSRSPQAKVMVVNYPQIFPDQGGGCWPQLPVAEGDVPWLRDKGKELNQMLADQATANGAELVDWYTASNGHDACQPPVIRWVEPAIPANAAAPVHPNLHGMLGASALVVAAGR